MCVCVVLIEECALFLAVGGLKVVGWFWFWGVYGCSATQRCGSANVVQSRRDSSTDRKSCNCWVQMVLEGVRDMFLCVGAKVGWLWLDPFWVDCFGVQGGGQWRVIFFGHSPDGF